MKTSTEQTASAEKTVQEATEASGERQRTAPPIEQAKPHPPVPLADRIEQANRQSPNQRVK